MNNKASKIATSRQRQDEAIARPKRADAQRKMNALLKAALDVFAESGVDAPVREIAERAGVGLGTLYRHFPHRSDLIVAVYRSQVDECANAAAELASRHEPFPVTSSPASGLRFRCCSMPLSSPERYDVDLTRPPAKVRAPRIHAGWLWT